jgi:hypothetical protein
MNDTTKGNACRRCGYRITWAEQRRQFARAIKCYGLTPEAAKELMPRCQTCLTSMLGRKAGAHRGVSPGWRAP